MNANASASPITSPFSLNDFPDEVLQHMVDFMADPVDASRLAAASPRFRRLIPPPLRVRIVLGLSNGSALNEVFFVTPCRSYDGEHDAMRGDAAGKAKTDGGVGTDGSCDANDAALRPLPADARLFYGQRYLLWCVRPTSTTPVAADNEADEAPAPGASNRRRLYLERYRRSRSSGEAVIPIDRAAHRPLGNRCTCNVALRPRRRQLGGWLLAGEDERGRPCDGGDGAAMQWNHPVGLTVGRDYANWCQRVSSEMTSTSGETNDDDVEGPSSQGSDDTEDDSDFGIDGGMGAGVVDGFQWHAGPEHVDADGNPVPGAPRGPSPMDRCVVVPWRRGGGIEGQRRNNRKTRLFRASDVAGYTISQLGMVSILGVERPLLTVEPAGRHI